MVIKQMIPAEPGWHAMCWFWDGKKERAQVVSEPVIGWAVVEFEEDDGDVEEGMYNVGETDIRPVSIEDGYAPEVVAFASSWYLGLADSAEDTWSSRWQKRADERAEQRRKAREESSQIARIKEATS